MNLSIITIILLLFVNSTHMYSHDFLPNYAKVEILANSSTKQTYPSSCQELYDLFDIDTGLYYISKNEQDSVVFCVSQDKGTNYCPSHYWPINDNCKDVINGSDFDCQEMHYIPDRNEIDKSAIEFSGSVSMKLKPDTYFENSFSFCIWLKFENKPKNMVKTKRAGKHDPKDKDNSSNKSCSDKPNNSSNKPNCNSTTNQYDKEPLNQTDSQSQNLLIFRFYKGFESHHFVLDKRNDKIYFSYYNGEATRFESYVDLGTDKEWFHVAFTYDTNNITSYLNGIRNHKFIWNEPIANEKTENNNFGFESSTNTNDKYAFSDFMIFKRALEPYEVDQVNHMPGFLKSQEFSQN